MKSRINRLNLIGIVVIAFGTYLVYLGSSRDSDKTQNQINEKLDFFNKKLDKTKMSNLPLGEKQKQLDAIQSQFDNWAKNLKNNYSEIELSHEKELLSRKEKTIATEKQWNDSLNKAFENIKSMVYSINKENPQNKVNINEINPSSNQDFFNDKKQYSLELEFRPGMVLTIYVEATSSDALQLNDPKIALHMVLFKSHYDKQSINTIIIYFLDQKHFYISKYGSFNYFIINNEKQYYAQSELTKIIQEILTYQFFSANKKT